MLEEKKDSKFIFKDALQAGWFFTWWQVLGGGVAVVILTKLFG